MLEDSIIFSVTKGDKELLKKFLDIFISCTGEDVQNLKNSVSSKDFRQTHYYVHKIKSSLKSIGFQKTQEILQETENQLITQANLEGMGGKLDLVITECEKAVNEAKVYCQKNGL